MHLKLLFSCIVVLVVGCAAIRPEIMVDVAKEYDPATEGIVAIKMHGVGPGFKPKYPIQVIVREVDSQEYTFFNTNNEGINIFRLPAGKYYLSEAYPGDVMLIHKFDSDKYNGETALPFKPFDVTPGRTLYLGDIKVNGVRYEKPFNGKSEKITYELSSSDDAEEEITAILKEKYPQYPVNFDTRAIEKI